MLEIIDLPNEILCEIFLHLASEDCLTCVFVCKRWQRLLADEAVWKTVCFNSHKSYNFSNTESIITEISNYLPPKSIFQLNELRQYYLHKNFSTGRYRTKELSICENVLSYDSNETDIALLLHLRLIFINILTLKVLFDRALPSKFEGLDRIKLCERYIILWSLCEGQMVSLNINKVLKGSYNEGFSITLPHRNNWRIVGDYLLKMNEYTDKEIQIVKISSGEPMNKLRLPSASTMVTYLTASEDKAFAISSLGEGGVVLGWNLSTGQLLFQTSIQGARVNLHISPCKKYICVYGFITSYNQTCPVICADKGTLLHTLHWSRGDKVYGRGNWLISCTMVHDVYQFKLQSLITCDSANISLPLTTSSNEGQYRRYPITNSIGDYLLVVYDRFIYNYNIPNKALLYKIPCCNQDQYIRIIALEKHQIITAFQNTMKQEMNAIAIINFCV